MLEWLVKLWASEPEWKPTDRVMSMEEQEGFRSNDSLFLEGGVSFRLIIVPK